MSFIRNSTFGDAVILAVVSKEKEGAYGYQITQRVGKCFEISESTLYPVLKRLWANGYLKTYDMQFEGRNRRYYKITKKGEIQLDQYRYEWKQYSEKITKIMEK